jgi:hypothetical protein
VLHRKQIALAGMATGLAMTSIGIGGLIVGNAGAEEPGHNYAVDGTSGVDLISPVSPVAPLEKKPTPPTESQPRSSAPGSEAPEVVETVPASPRAVEESTAESTSPGPARPTHIPSESPPAIRPRPPASPRA